MGRLCCFLLVWFMCCSCKPHTSVPRTFSQFAADSISVTDAEVNDQLDNRIKYFISLYGSQQKLEQGSKKDLAQIRADNRVAIVQELKEQKLYHAIVQNITVTPAEVAAFFHNIPADSLPLFPATVRLGQIAIASSSSGLQATLHRLDSIRTILVARKMFFPDAVQKYSTDTVSLAQRGMITDPATGGKDIAATMLDSATALAIADLEPGGYSRPQPFTYSDGVVAGHFLYLVSRLPAHKANLHDDYDRLQEAALDRKQGAAMQQWMKANNVQAPPLTR